MLDFRLFDKSTCPGAGFRWSETLNKWRRDPAPFRWDRFGVHFLLGILATWACPSWQTLAIVCALFAIYEIFESKVIFDEAYPDVGGWVSGMVAYYGIVKVLTYFI